MEDEEERKEGGLGHLSLAYTQHLGGSKLNSFFLHHLWHIPSIWGVQKWIKLFYFIYSFYFILLLGGYVDRVPDWCVIGRGFAPRRVQLWNKFHLSLWCIHCVRTILSPGCAIPSLIFHYQCVCSCVCIWCWLLCRCACESERVLCEEAKCFNNCNTFAPRWVCR